ncbi:MAG: glycoside hydrolase family 92 protein, partial [Cytophagales bacterium]|nr:glycoside hydrolase family 92 protein [Cytophagales bacterium]
SALGFYPVTPATTQYVIGSPLFEKVTLTMENGKTLVIKANMNNAKNVFIESVKFNGKAHDHTWVDHHDLQKGGVLEFTMTDSPNKNWGTNKSSIPFSMSNHKDK